MLYTVLCSFLGHSLGFHIPEKLESANKSLLRIVLFYVVLYPLIETLIFQFTTIEILRRLNASHMMTILISSLIFGAFHTYHVFYVLSAIGMGALFAFYYIVIRDNRATPAFLYVWVLHSALNGSAFILDFFYA